MDNNDEKWREEFGALIAGAYKNIDEQQPGQALEKVLEVLRKTKCSEQSIMALMDKAKTDYDVSHHQPINVRVEADSPQLKTLLGTGESILAEGGLGRENIILDAAADASSYMCPNCRSLISVKRWDAHISIWCPALPEVEE